MRSNAEHASRSTSVRALNRAQTGAVDTVAVVAAVAADRAVAVVVRAQTVHGDTTTTLDVGGLWLVVADLSMVSGVQGGASISGLTIGTNEDGAQEESSESHEPNIRAVT